MELTLEVKGRKLLFRFTTRAWHNLEKKVGSLNKLLNRVSDDDRPMDAMLELCAETATAGEHYNGSKDVITKEWLIDNLSPLEVKRAHAMARDALTIGMRRENVDQDDSEVIDVYLEEAKAAERAKKERAARMTAQASPQDSASDTD